MHSLRTDDLHRPRHLNYCLNTSSGPWRCEAKCDHVGQKDLKPALISRDSQKYSFTTKSFVIKTNFTNISHNDNSSQPIPSVPVNIMISNILIYLYNYKIALFR